VDDGPVAGAEGRGEPAVAAAEMDDEAAADAGFLENLCGVAGGIAGRRDDGRQDSPATSQPLR